MIQGTSTTRLPLGHTTIDVHRDRRLKPLALYLGLLCISVFWCVLAEKLIFSSYIVDVAGLAGLAGFAHYPSPPMMYLRATSTSKLSSVSRIGPVPTMTIPHRLDRFDWFDCGRERTKATLKYDTRPMARSSLSLPLSLSLLLLLLLLSEPESNNGWGDKLCAVSLV